MIVLYVAKPIGGISEVVYENHNHACSNYLSYTILSFPEFALFVLLAYGDSTTPRTEKHPLDLLNGMVG